MDDRSGVYLQRIDRRMGRNGVSWRGLEDRRNEVEWRGLADRRNVVEWRGLADRRNEVGWRGRRIGGKDCFEEE